MSITTLPQQEYFRTSIVRGLSDTSKPDRAAGTIPGIKAIQFGRLNDDRPWKIDNTTLEQVVSLVNQRNTGAKMRFAHPNMSRDGMGRHLGRATNARIVGEGENAFVAVDAKLSDASKRTPSGNLYDHVFDLAIEAPEDFGVSLAPVLDQQAMSKIEPDTNGLRPLRIKDLRAIDFVDEPAATRGGLFSIDSDSPADLAAQASWLLETHFADAAPDVIRGRVADFLETFFRNKGVQMSTIDQTATLAAKDAEIATLKTKVAELSKTPAAGTFFADPADAAKADARAELNRRGEITALCTLAKVSDGDRDLILAAGFSRQEAQDYLKVSGRLSISNPAIQEGGADTGKPAQTPDEKFGAEFDANADLYLGMSLSKEAYIASRKKDK